MCRETAVPWDTRIRHQLSVDASVLCGQKVSFLLENFTPKMQNLRLKTHFLWKLDGKIEILSTHNFLCWKPAAVC